MERRQFPRKRVLMSGKIIFNNGYSTLSCQIRNASKEGMGLRIPNTQGIPKHVRILVDRDQSKFNADVIWRTTDSLGIRIAQGAF